MADELPRSGDEVVKLISYYVSSFKKPRTEKVVRIWQLETVRKASKVIHPVRTVGILTGHCSIRYLISKSTTVALTIGNEQPTTKTSLQTFLCFFSLFITYHYSLHSTPYST